MSIRATYEITNTVPALLLQVMPRGVGCHRERL